MGPQWDWLLLLPAFRSVSRRKDEAVMAVLAWLGPSSDSHAGGQVGAEPVWLNAGVGWQAPDLGRLLEPLPPQTPPARVSGYVPSLLAAWALLSIRPAGSGRSDPKCRDTWEGPHLAGQPPYSWALLSSQGRCGAAPHGCGAGPGTQLPLAARSACDRVLEAGFVLSVLFPDRRSVGLLPPTTLTLPTCAFPGWKGKPLAGTWAASAE